MASVATPGREQVWRSLAFVAVGLGVLVAGSRMFVIGAVDVARGLGIREVVIGLTVVAAGTSLPELASSLVAAFRKQADIAIGNIVGSNIFNLLAILGISGVTAGPLKGPGITPFDLWVMFGLSAVLMPLLWTGFKISRWEGWILLAAYAGYLYKMWPK